MKCPACNRVFTTPTGYGAHTRGKKCGGGTPEQRFWACIEKTDGCWNFTRSVKTEGYCFFRYKKRQWYAHRFSWILHNGEIPTGLDVAHKCDNRRCCKPGHLFLATHAENMQDCNAKGRYRHERRKLTPDQAREIMSLRGIEGAPELTERFGVSLATIHNIWSGKSHKYAGQSPQDC